MKRVLTALKETLSAGQPVALVSVSNASGATPRAAGAHMAVGRSGLLAGTIGGGAVEHRALMRARDQLDSGRSADHEYVLNRSDVEDLGMICGGDVTVRFYVLDGEHHLAAVEAALLALDAHIPVLLIHGLDGEQAILLAWSDGTLTGDPLSFDREQLIRALKTVSGRRFEPLPGLFAEPIARAGRAVIFGGGHVGRALAQVLHAVDFPVVVLDDREAFLLPGDYPEGVLLKLADFTDIDFPIAASDYVCIMTRGHKFDQIVQAQLLKTEAAYIGVIGSAHKSRTVAQNLKEEYGFTDEDLSRITTPIGLSIMAETPEEIAVSIAAQLIEVRARREQG